MRKWQLTIGLVLVALCTTAIAPRLGPPSPPTSPSARESHHNHPVAGPKHLMLTAALDRSAVLDGSAAERFLVIRVQTSPNHRRAARRAVDMAVVLDGSGSMSADNKIDHAKDAASHLAYLMQPADSFGLVVFSDDVDIVRPSGPVGDPDRVRRALDRVYEGGGSNLYDGLVTGGREVARTLRDDTVGRIVLLSDGRATVGETRTDRIAAQASTLAAQGITVSTIGLGLHHNEDALMHIARAGGGDYDFVEDASELEDVLVDELSQSARLVTKDVHAELELPEHVALIEVLGWDATHTEDGVDVRIGDMSAERTAEIIARVRVMPGAERFDVGTVTLYHTRTQGQPLVGGRATVSATTVDDAASVARSLDRDLAEVGTKALGQRFLDASSRAYERGQLHESREMLTRGAAVLRAASEELESPALLSDAEHLDELRVLFETSAPQSPRVRRAIKRNKEAFRGRAR